MDCSIARSGCQAEVSSIGTLTGMRETRNAAWNNWLHCTGSTYGTWLRGDPRGWRSRDREHVDGDYKRPPPKGKYDELHEQSKRLMKRARVVLNPEQRRSG